MAKLQFSSFELSEHKRKNELNEIPLNIGIFGTFSTGKSSIINSIIGDNFLLDDVNPSTALISILKYGDKEKIRVHKKNGDSSDLTKKNFWELANHKKTTDIESEIDHFEIYYPSEVLRNINLIDTPGFSSTSEEDDDLTKVWFKKVDTLLWVFDVNKGTIHKDELDLLNKMSKEIGNDRITAILNKVDRSAPSNREKLFESFHNSFQFNKTIYYSAKKVLSNENRKVINEETIKNVIFSIDLDRDESVVKIYNKGKEGHEITIDNNLDQKFKLKNINKNDEYSKSKEELELYFADLHIKKKKLKIDEVKDKENEFTDKLMHVYQNERCNLSSLLDKIDLLNSEFSKDYVDCKINISKFNKEFKKHRRNKYQNVKKSLFNEILKELKGDSSYEKLQCILKEKLRGEYFDESLNDLSKFIKMNDYNFNFYFDEELAKINYHLEQLMNASVNSINGICKIRYSFIDTSTEIIDLLIPDEQYNNISENFFNIVVKNLLNELKIIYEKKTRFVDESRDEIKYILKTLDDFENDENNLAVGIIEYGKAETNSPKYNNLNNSGGL